MRTLIQGGTVYTGCGFERRDLFIEDGRIAAPRADFAPDEVIDAAGLIVSPGFIDLHVHLRQPGQEQKETIRSGTMAAAAGGFTTVCAMPNLAPPPDSMENLALERRLIEEDAVCRVLPFATITAGRAGGVPVPLRALAPHCVGFSDDGSGVQDMAVMERAFIEAAACGALISAHCEDMSLIEPGGCVHEDYARRHSLPAISSASEYRQIERDIELVRRTGCRYHVCHVSARESVELVRAAKAEGLPVSCEITPHHALLCQDDMADDGRFKMNPPLRSREDMLALREALRDGTADAIATDHAPHLAEEKSRGLRGSAMGVVGLETAFAVLNTGLVETGELSLERLLELLTFGPAGVIRVPCGWEAGAPADIVLLDRQGKGVVDSSRFFSKGRSTPFEGMNTAGRIICTLVGGKPAFKTGEAKR